MPIFRHDKYYVDKTKPQKPYKFLTYHKLKTRDRKLIDRDIAEFHNVSSKTIERWNKRYKDDLNEFNEYSRFILRKHEAQFKRQISYTSVYAVFPNIAPL